MDFSEQIKDLRKRYFNAVKMFYGDNRIVAKMILNRTKYDDLYEASLSFKTIALPQFSDERLDKLAKERNPLVVEQLLARARGCLYTALAVQRILNNQISNNQNKACNEIRYIKQQLISCSDMSVKSAEHIAKKLGLANIDKIEFDEMKQFIKSKSSMQGLNQK